MATLEAINIKRFFDFINERHLIYLKKSREEPYPWTNDPILQTYKFTNVYRELDTGTVWYRKHIREPYENDENLFFNTAVYRRHNLISTAEELGYIHNYDTAKYVAMMKKRQSKGLSIFTGAYMTCGGLKDPATGEIPKSKIDQIFGIAFTALWDKRKEVCPQPGDNLEKAFNRLNGKVPGFGPFLAYEVITDLRWTRLLKKADDIMTWANPGPGAQRGLIRIAGFSVDWRNNLAGYKEGRKQFGDRKLQIFAMQSLLDISHKYLADWMQPLEMRDIEHSLCEFDKYERVRTGEGRPRGRYHYKQV